MLQAACRSLEFNRSSDASSHPGGETKEKTEANAVSDSEDDRVLHRPSKQPQRPMLAAQQVVGKIQTSEHIKTCAGNADGCDGVVIYGVIAEGALKVWGLAHGAGARARLQPCRWME